MRRIFNYTGREKLYREHITITSVDRHDSEYPACRATIDLTTYDFPETAKVYLEAYFKSSMMRFDYGTVNQVLSFADKIHYLDELQSNTPTFRVKVVDESEDIGRLIAVADGIQSSAEETKKVEKLPLLYVSYEDLEDRIWSLDLTEVFAMPTLLINSSLDLNQPVNEVVRTHPLFVSLVFPNVVEQILSHIILNIEDVDETDVDNWRTKWITYGKTLTRMYIDRDISDLTDDEREAWVNHVVHEFCILNDVKMNFEKFINNESN